MTIKEIVKEWLKKNGYDGLCHPDCACGCLLEYLMDCADWTSDGPDTECEPGYKRNTTEEEKADMGDWVIVLGRKEKGLNHEN